MADASASARRPSGELEASVLAALWAADGRPLTPGDVQRDLATALGADLARTTVTTILARLHDKGSVSRTRSGRGYAYLPAQDPPGLAARRMRTELDKSAEGLRGTVLARFVSELDPSDERLLRELLAEAEAPPGAPGALEDGAGFARPGDSGGPAGPGTPEDGAGFGRPGDSGGPAGPGTPEDGAGFGRPGDSGGPAGPGTPEDGAGFGRPGDPASSGVHPGGPGVHPGGPGTPEDLDAAHRSGDSATPGTSATPPTPGTPGPAAPPTPGTSRRPRAAGGRSGE